MVNPGSFQGARKRFLLSQKKEYEEAVLNNRPNETLTLIQKRFFKRFPIDMPDDVEPTEEELALVDDKAPDEDYNGPGSELEEDLPDLGSSQRTKKNKKSKKKIKKDSKSRSGRIEFRKGQIKRWMAYQYAKDNTNLDKESGAFNPYKVLLYKLAGRLPKKPRKIPVLNYWRKSHREEIEAALNTEIAEAIRIGRAPTPKSHYATRREQIARDMFKVLPADEKKKWQEDAEHQYTLDLAKYEHEMSLPISTLPADRQRAIQALPQFIQPILDLVYEVTGWPSTYIGGGPEPALGGRLNVMSVHSGVTKGDIPMNFGCAQRAAYIKEWVPIYGEFLKDCFSPDDCRARALDPKDGFIPMSEIEAGGEEQQQQNTTFVDPISDGPGLSIPSAIQMPIQRRELSNDGRSYSMDVSMSGVKPASSMSKNDESNEDSDNPFPFNHPSSASEHSEGSLPPSPMMSPGISPGTMPTSKRSEHLKGDTDIPNLSLPTCAIPPSDIPTPVRESGTQGRALVENILPLVTGDERQKQRADTSNAGSKRTKKSVRIVDPTRQPSTDKPDQPHSSSLTDTSNARPPALPSQPSHSLSNQIQPHASNDASKRARKKSAKLLESEQDGGIGIPNGTTQGKSRPNVDFEQPPTSPTSTSDIIPKKRPPISTADGVVEETLGSKRVRKMSAKMLELEQTKRKRQLLSGKPGRGKGGIDETENIPGTGEGSKSRCGSGGSKKVQVDASS